MEKPGKDTKRWADKVKEAIYSHSGPTNDNEWSEVVNKIKKTKLYKKISHKCNPNWSIVNCDISPEDEPGNTDSILVITTYKCEECQILKVVYLYNSGAVAIRDPGNDQYTPMGLCNFPVTVKQVKNGALAGGYYEEEIPIEEFMKFEHPGKFTKPEQWKRFERNFPDEYEEARRTCGEKNEKHQRRQLYQSKCGKKPYIKTFFTIIKKISGCEFSIRKHTATLKLFENCKDHECLVKFFLYCRFAPKYG